METTEGAELCFPLLNESCRKPQSDGVFVNVLLSFISVQTTALNLLVIISISHFRQLHSPTNLLILSLAVSDFLVGLLLMPIDIVFSEVCWFLGDLLCALYLVVDFIITTSSSGNMVLISVDRYLAICDPLRYNTRVTLDKTKICVFLFWISCILYSILILIDSVRHPDTQKSCHGECLVIFNWIQGAVDLVVTIIAPITVIIVLYMRIFVVVVSQAQAMQTHIASVTKQHPVGVTAKKSEMKAARTLGVVVVVYLVCLFPLYISSFVVHKTSLVFEIWLFYFNSCLNPLIYAFFYPWFRQSVKIIVTFRIFKNGSCNMKIL